MRSPVLALRLALMALSWAACTTGHLTRYDDGGTDASQDDAASDAGQLDGGVDATPSPPARLSETGLFSDIDAGVIAADVEDV